MSGDIANPKGRGLGRGLNALFEDDEDLPTQLQSLDEASIQKAKTMLGVDQLRPGIGQPRRNFDEGALSELADSIKQHGVLQPLLVRLLDGQSDEYEIIAGERRWRAAQKAQLHQVPVVILEISDVEAYEIALIENLQREDLDPIDEAVGFQKLMEEYEYTQEKLAKAMGKSRSYIANITRLLNLPDEVQQQVSSGALSAGHARALITAENALELANEIIAGNLSVRETEKLVSSKSSSSTAKKKSSSGSGSSTSSNSEGPQGFVSNSKDPDVVAVENELTNALGMQVDIDSANGRSGKISIHFSSIDQMDELMRRLLTMPQNGLPNRLRN